MGLLCQVGKTWRTDARVQKVKIWPVHVAFVLWDRRLAMRRSKKRVHVGFSEDQKCEAQNKMIGRTQNSRYYFWKKLLLFRSCSSRSPPWRFTAHYGSSFTALCLWSSCARPLSPPLVWKLEIVWQRYGQNVYPTSEAVGEQRTIWLVRC